MTAINDVTDFSKEGEIGIITLNSPPVNALSANVRDGLVAAFRQAIAYADVKAIVLICEGKTFIAGADITEFGKPPRGASLFEVEDVIESSPKPVVAAIHGTALGGGLEVALCAHYRVAVPSAKCGLPEVNIGLLPGAGGTQRLPRIVPMSKAVQMMTTGNPISAEEALQLGLVDEIVQGGDLLAAAVVYANKLVAEKKPLKRIRDMKANADVDFKKVREEVAKSSRGYPAPLEIVACAEAAVNKPFDEGRKFERERFAHLVQTDESKALRHAFFSERQTSKIPDVPEDTPTRTIRKAAVIGAGTMGGGIAMSLVNAGIPVTITDTTQEALDRGLKKIKDNYAATVSKGRLKQEEMDKRMGLLTPTTNVDAAAKDADIIVEAVFERMDVKQDLFKKLDAVAKPGAILATNTSTLDVNKIADATQRPQDVIGTHFFSPANVMRLLEVVRAKKTGKDVLATTMKLGKTLKKVPVVSGVCDGFIGNRMLEKYTQQAYFLIDEGASPQQVDGALQRWGMAMGPFTMYDMAGNDIGWEIRKRRAKERPDFVYGRFADRIAEKGWFGQKTGRGWYRYQPGNRKPIPDPEVDSMLDSYRKEMALKTRTISDDEIVERCMYALANEGAHILGEGIALRASDIDMVYLTGYGFPLYRGGPMFYADTVGLANVLGAIEKFQRGYQGNQWKPAPLLVKLANEGRRFNG